MDKIEKSLVNNFKKYFVNRTQICRRNKQRFTLDTKKAIAKSVITLTMKITKGAARIADTDGRKIIKPKDIMASSRFFIPTKIDGPYLRWSGFTVSDIDLKMYFRRIKEGKVKGKSRSKKAKIALNISLIEKIMRMVLNSPPEGGSDTLGKDYRLGLGSDVLLAIIIQRYFGAFLRVICDTFKDKKTITFYDVEDIKDEQPGVRFLLDNYF